MRSVRTYMYGHEYECMLAEALVVFLVHKNILVKLPTVKHPPPLTRRYVEYHWGLHAPPRLVPSAFVPKDGQSLFLDYTDTNKIHRRYIRNTSNDVAVLLCLWNLCISGKSNPSQRFRQYSISRGGRLTS